MNSLYLTLFNLFYHGMAIADPGDKLLKKIPSLKIKKKRNMNRGNLTNTLASI